MEIENFFDLIIDGLYLFLSVGVDEVGCGVLFGFVVVVVVILLEDVLDDLVSIGVIDSKKLMEKCCCYLVFLIWIVVWDC